MAHRFFLETLSQQLKLVSKSANERDLPLAGEATITLGGDQAHHAIQVMRFKSGDELVLFDGSGLECRAVIQSANKKNLELAVIAASQTGSQPTRQIEIAVALPKGDRQKFLIEKLVELGVSRLIPLKSNRSVAVANSKVIERLKKQVIEACKQCERNVLMEIAEEQTVPNFVSAVTATATVEKKCLWADPYHGVAINRLSQSAVSVPRFIVAVGPEGGFDESESALALAAGFEPVRIGAHILRVETACLAAATVLGLGYDGASGSCEA